MPASHTTCFDAHHAFIRVRNRFLKKAATFKKCGPVVLTEDGDHVGDGFSDRTRSWSDHVTAAFRECGQFGACVAGTEETRRMARDDRV